MALEKAGLELVAENAPAYVDAMGRAHDATGKFVKGIGAAADEASASGDVMTGALRRVGEVATDFAMEAAAAVGQFVTDSIGAAGDFEAGMNRFGAVTGDALAESGQSLDDFTQLFLDMGAQTQFSAGQAQDAAIALAKGGLDPATISAGGLKAALDLAAAGELDLAQAAEISAKQYGVWVDAAASAEEKSRFLAQSADLLAQAANASTVDVGDLALGMSNVGGVAKLAGASFQETVTAMALLAPGFSSASDAGTSLKTMLARLIPSTDAQSKKMAELGLLTREGTSAFYDAEGSFIGMEASAQLLQDSLAGLSNEQKQAALQTIFGSDAIRAAAALAEGGAEGYRRMAEQMSAAGTAAEQAAKRNQGFNFALESAKGSLETFGIVAGTLALPALTELLNSAIIPAINAATTFASALGDPTTGLGMMAEAISGGLLPTLIGLGVATMTYAVSQLPMAIIAVQASVTAFLAQAAAVALAAAPFVVLGAAIAGAAIIYDQFNDKVEDATTQLLESREWWNESADAIDTYKAAHLEGNKAIAATAATITELRSQIEEEVASLGRRSAAGLVSEQQYATEMAAINMKADALQVATGHLNAQVEAENNAAAASLTATEMASTLTGGIQAMGGQASLTAEDIQALGDKIIATFQQGGEALGAYAATEAEFLTGAEERRSAHVATIEELEAQKRQATTAEQKAAIDEQIAQANTAYLEQETAQATSYAEQQAAQQAHLGQMLIDYTNAQVMLGNITAEKAAEITSALVTEYGIQEDSAASTFAAMAASIDDYASDSGGSIDNLIGDLRDNQAAAVDTEQAMTKMSKEYVATAVANFVEKKGEAADYAGELRSIPSRVETEVHTKYTSSGTPSQGAKSKHGGEVDDNAEGAKAMGGPVRAAEPYVVGELGREIFVPQTDGTIVPSGIFDAMVQAEARRVAAPTTGGMGGASVVAYGDTINVDARGSNLSAAQIRDAVTQALDSRTSRADRLARTGGGAG